MIIRQSIYIILVLFACVIAGNGKGFARENELKGLNKNAGIQGGTPYFSETYKYATIILVQGRTLKNVKARIDLVESAVQFMTANGVEALLNRGMVREVSYADTTDSIITQYLFRTGFPPIDKITQGNFYLVLADGRCSFLKSITKKVTTTRSELSGGTITDYETLEEYYIFTKGEIKRWKKDKDFILNELSDKRADVDQFVLANKTNFRNVESVTRLVNYYNSL